MKTIKGNKPMKAVALMSTAKLLIFSLATEKCGRHTLTRESSKDEI